MPDELSNTIAKLQERLSVLKSLGLSPENSEQIQQVQDQLAEHQRQTPDLSNTPAPDLCVDDEPLDL